MDMKHCHYPFADIQEWERDHFNRTHNYTQWATSHEHFLKWHGPEVIFVCIMVLVGTVGNILVIYVYTCRSRHDPMALTKRWLSIFDLVFLVIPMPMYVYLVIVECQEHFLLICRTLWFIALSSVISSVQVLLAIAVDRYLKLCRVRLVGISDSLNQKVIAVSVVFGCLLNLPVFWLFGCKYVMYDWDEHHFTCFVADRRNNVFYGIWTFSLAAYLVAVLTALIWLYVNIMNKLTNLTTFRQSYLHPPSQSQFQQNELAVTKSVTTMQEKKLRSLRFSSILFICITTLFVCSYIPFLISLIMEWLFFNDQQFVDGPTLKGLRDICRLSLMITHVANPFIYSFVTHRFREELRAINIFHIVDTMFVQNEIHLPQHQAGHHPLSPATSQLQISTEHWWWFKSMKRAILTKTSSVDPKKIEPSSSKCPGHF